MIKIQGNSQQKETKHEHLLLDVKMAVELNSVILVTLLELNTGNF